MDLSRVLYLSIVLAFVILGLVRYKLSLKVMTKFTVLWSIFVAILFIGYSYKYEVKNIFDKLYINLVPGAAMMTEGSVQLIADQNGHFIARAEVEGVQLKFLVDTGATNVSLSWDDAKKLGIKFEELRYIVRTETANGTVWSAPVTLKYIQLGKIIVHNVRALVNQYDNLNTSLLGMSFLEKLESYRVSNDTMIMTSTMDE